MRNAEPAPWKVPWKGFAVALVVSGLALALVFSKVAEPGEILEELENYPLQYFFLAVSAVIVSWVVDGQRIGVLARSLGYFEPWWLLGLVLGAANFLTLVTPFAGGGGALIIYYLYRRGMSVPQATATVTAGGLAGQICLAALAILVLPNLKTAPSPLVNYLLHIQLALLGYILILIVLLYLAAKGRRLVRFFNRRKKGSKTGAWLEEFQRTYLILLGKRKGAYLISLAVAFFYYLVYYTAGFLLLSGLGVFSGLFRYSFSVFLGIAPVFSPIPGGAGAAELVAYWVLEEALARDILGTFIVLWRTTVFYLPILIGGVIFSVLALKWASRPKENSPVSVILSEDNDHNR